MSKRIGDDGDRIIVEHDGCADYQVCARCYLTLGTGITTEYDVAYYADDHDPAVCPRCGGEMGMWGERTYRIEVREEYGNWVPAPGDADGWTRDEAEQIVADGVPTMIGGTFDPMDVRIVEED